MATTAIAAGMLIDGSTLTIANGTISAVGTILQRVSTIVSAVASGTTQIPSDNTIPQSTEGDQYMSLSITPKSATSALVIDYKVQYTTSVSGGYVAAPLFQDSTANALATAWASVDFTTFSGEGLVGRYIMTSGTTSSTTFKVRAGPSTALTLTFNGVNASGLYGGTSNSYITITEYA